ncbi:MAG TPA: transglutaminase-like domain-containing protein [Acidimicrobiales bacterium]|nr:transglutaminase-like domain-containing protein [Acidimicrobiales bacterium]
MNQAALDYYAAPGGFTSLREFATSAVDVSGVVEVVQGLLVYDLVAQGLYGVDLTPAQGATIHERDAAAIVDAAVAVDDRRLDEARPPAARVAGRCHTFAKLTVAFLRSAGVPARARCGFGTTFVPGRLEDHWIAEYWNTERRRWCQVDAQLDATWRRMIGFDADPLDLPDGVFVSAGHAWQAWRQGELDAGHCGLTAIDEHGAHWIAGNLRLDLAALNKVEMLPWDVWGLVWEPGTEPDDAALRACDEVAALTVDPDSALDEVRQRYERDPDFHMDGTVFNVERGAFESVVTGQTGR